MDTQNIGCTEWHMFHGSHKYINIVDSYLDYTVYGDYCYYLGYISL